MAELTPSLSHLRRLKLDRATVIIFHRTLLSYYTDPPRTPWISGSAGSPFDCAQGHARNAPQSYTSGFYCADR